MTAPYWLNTHDPTDFPDVSLALTDPDGLLAVGGDLTVKRLLTAYQRGIFPWFSEDQPILWWSPDPRAVLFPERLKISRSLRKTLRKQVFKVTFDKAFTEVIQACSEPRADQNGTWITDDMQQAYVRLHEAGHAHSVECWQDGQLVGGLYGVSIGKIFFGESMFSRVSDASKLSFVYLVKHLASKGYPMIDCQVYSEHLESLGAINILRSEFVKALDTYCKEPGWDQPWEIENSIVQNLVT
ncbi:MAG: leucyl/phenylalanyl-tRNA--protein transferase [Gammaproteobacteria bacterium]|nr:leucyl/phenylalanyl-tRNA--protein transferase [Gammaproteobacteria bacterium]